MKEFMYKIKDPEGIHARPAGVIVKKASEFESNITIENKGKTADAKKIFAIMGLIVKNGEEVHVTIEGSDEEKACNELKMTFEENL